MDMQKEFLDIPGKVRATPAARRIAKERGIDLFKIKGTGPKGRIQEKDVVNFKRDSLKVAPLARRIAESEGINLADIKGSGSEGKIMKEDLLKAKKEKDLKQKPVENLKKEIEVIPMSNMRKIIGERMSQSFFSAPTFTLNTEVDMTKVKKLRGEIKEDIMEKTGEKVTITDIILTATAKALKNHPMINASLSEDGQGIIIHDYVNLAVAVGMEKGLLTPVIKDADKKSLTEMVIAEKDVTERTMNMKLSPDELQGSTFTVSNLGMYGITHFNPIINPPNSAILGVNAIVDRIVPVGGQPVIRSIMTLSLTVDHRIIDGLIGAKFLKELKYLLENPLLILV